VSKDEILVKILGSPLMSSWHWFQWHFTEQYNGKYHPFSDEIVSSIAEVDRAIPGYADEIIKGITTICGREKYVPHYEQLLQILAELHIIKKIVHFDWPELEGFDYEPTASGSDKNPEVSVKYSGIEVGIEVKSPSLITHINNRSTNPTQIVSRVLSKDTIGKLSGSDEGVTFPRDNTLKDFLKSANEKFRYFKEERNNFYGVLVVVWDDFIYEPISALIHEHGGLLTDESFFKDAEGKPVKFNYIDGVIVVRHLHQFMRASRDEPLLDNCRGAFDYGIDGEFPQKCLVINPDGPGLPKEVVTCFQAYSPENELGTEYTPKDIVWWL